VKLISDLIKRDGPHCNMCRKELVATGPRQNRPTIDHIRPKVKDGINRMDNYQLLCPPCNQAKGDFWDGISGVGLVGGRMPKMVKSFQVVPGGLLVDNGRAS